MRFEIQNHNKIKLSQIGLEYRQFIYKYNPFTSIIRLMNFYIYLIRLSVAFLIF